MFFLYFNPLAPYGARRRTIRNSRWKHNFNPRAPYGARRRKLLIIVSKMPNFNPRAPYGARPPLIREIFSFSYFNPRAPYGARQQKYTKIACVFAITDKGQMLFPRQAPPVRTLFEGAGENRDETRCEPSRKYRTLALRTTGSSAPLEGMFVCSQSVRSYSHTFSRDNKTEGCPFLHP